MTYDSRFNSDDNVVRRAMEVFHLVLLGFLVWNIKPAGIMANTHDHPAALIFTGALVIDTFWLMSLYVDVYFNVIGGPEAKSYAQEELKRRTCSATFYIIAFGICVRDYYFLALESMDDNYDTSTIDVNYWPAYFLIIGYVLEFWIYTPLARFLFLPRRGLNYEDLSVPMNIEYVMDRMGEFVMLLLGESVLNIIVEEGEYNWRYFTTFTAGIFTITMLQYMYYRSTPSDPKNHALFRRDWIGFMVLYWYTIYFASLIILGSS